MEGLVCYDHLWTSLQVNLLNSLRSNSFIPDKLRVFDRCCTVIDAAFALLDNSSNVDWRSPELGSLAHYFELFVTDCFQGMFVDRAIGFRVGLIKARFCKAILTQFLDEFKRIGTVVFRSHWDVASLARVFYSLGVGDNADVEFWKSFVDGGSIGADLMARTHATLETAARDGPLLNFCRLGHLGMMAVPFDGSGLEDTVYFKELLELLQKMADDPRLPLTLASTLVWDDLGRLREEVSDIFARSSNKDEVNMQDLLEKIDAIYGRRPSSIQEHPSDHVQSQASGTSPVMQPSPRFSGQIPTDDRSSYASSSTTVIEDRHDDSPVQEDDHRGITPAPLNNSRGEFPNLYRNAYPHLPSQMSSSGAITRPYSASFLPTLSHPLESSDIASPGLPSIQPPLLPMRFNDQHHRASYYTPRVAATSRSATLSSLQLPTRALSSSTTTIFVSPSDGVISSSPPASPAD
ncbi:hypothetical protein EDB89DRAFT_1984969 [Lactarius sanguifluus]|nr:hypothetical protein EDB89DRAFT_1984969 [Lactarius sanguifluus]